MQKVPRLLLAGLFVVTSSAGAKVIPSSEPARSAYLKEAIASGQPIQTGAGAQAEVSFANGVLVRLGQNSVFAVKPGTTSFELRRGAMLVRAPKSAGQTLISTGNVVSAVAGTTSLLEHYPDAYTKLISIEGTARMYMPSRIGESVLVDPGQLLMFHLKPAPTGLPNPVDIDIRRLMETSLLIKGHAPLGNESSIAERERDQTRQKSKGALADTNLVIFGRGTLVTLLPPTPAEKAPAGNKASPTPSPTAARPGR
ncbi:MAG: FecR domain-containing protein [Chthoniobacterales bacterium]